MKTMNTSRERELLSAETRRHYAFFVLHNGWKQAFKSLPNFGILLLACAAAWLIMLHPLCMAPPFLRPLLCCMGMILTVFAVIFGFYALGYVPGAWNAYDNFVRIGFVNAAGEAPLLVCRHETGKSSQLTFRCKGLPPHDWTTRLEEIQSALNLLIGRVQQGDDLRTVIITTVPPGTVWGKLLLWKEQYLPPGDAELVLGETIAGDPVSVDLDLMPMLLVGGSTGSGKTRLCRLLIHQLLAHGARVFVIDLKGLDFQPLKRRHVRVATRLDDVQEVLLDAVDTLYERLERLCNAECSNIREYRNKTGQYMQRMVILIDECAMLTDSGKTEKKQADVCIDALKTLTRMGRAAGIHVIVCTQRPDSVAVPGSIKSNLDGRICGKADAILSTIILGDGRANERIPKDAQGRFIMSDGAADVVFQAYWFDETNVN